MAAQRSSARRVRCSASRSACDLRPLRERDRRVLLFLTREVGVTVVHPGGIKTSIADNALQNARALGQPITDADEARRRMYNDKLLRMDPAEAAEIIIKGVESGRSRIRVGNDAKVVDLVVRAFPSLYPRLVVALDKRMRR
jgi:short-subunit dehydrogenase